MRTIYLDLRKAYAKHLVVNDKERDIGLQVNIEGTHVRLVDLTELCCNWKDQDAVNYYIRCIITVTPPRVRMAWRRPI